MGARALSLRAEFVVRTSATWPKSMPVFCARIATCAAVIGDQLKVLPAVERHGEAQIKNAAKERAQARAVSGPGFCPDLMTDEQSKDRRHERIHQKKPELGYLMRPAAE